MPWRYGDVAALDGPSLPATGTLRMIAGFRRKRHRDGRAGGVLACGRGVTRASANVDDLSAMLPGPVEEKIAFGLKIGSIDGST